MKTLVHAESCCLALAASMMDVSAFVLMFFASKRVELITAFLCWGPEGIISLQRAARTSGVRLRLVPTQVAPPALPAYGTTREGMLLDLDCPHYLRVVQQASESRAFNLRHTWLLLTNASLSAWSPSASLGSAQILPDADVTVSAAESSADLYRIKRDQPWIVTTLGLGRDSSLRQWMALLARLPTAVQRRSDLRNVTIAADTIVSQPQHFLGWSELSNRQIDTFPKLTYPLMMLVAEDLNFQYNLRQTDSYGECVNGSFSGLAGRLQRGATEIGVASMFMRADRLRVLHFLAETVELRGAFLFLAPPQAAVSNVFLLPFSRGLWTGLAVLFIAVFMLLTILPRLTDGATDSEMVKMSPGEAFTFTIGAVCQQGHWLTPSRQWCRLVMFAAVLLALFAFTSYSATVVAILQAPSEAVRSVDDLAKSSMRAGVQDTTYKRVYFAESSDPSTQALYRRKLQPLGDAAYLSVVDGIARVRKGFFAFQVEESAGYDVVSRTFTAREKCALRHVLAFRLPMVGVPAKRHSGYRDLLAARLRWQREVGLTGRWRAVWLATRTTCEPGAAGLAGVELSHVLPAIQLLACGAALSLVLLVLELAAHWRQRWRERRSGEQMWAIFTAARPQGSGHAIDKCYNDRQ